MSRVRHVDRRIKKRRDERIRSLQHARTPWPTVPRHHPRERMTSPQPDSLNARSKKRARFLTQTVFAGLLFLFTYIVFQGESSTARGTQAFITEVMERDFNFEGVAEWYEANLGDIPAIIPTFSRNNKIPTIREHQLRAEEWSSPVQGRVMERYREDHPYLTLHVDEPGVKASAEGLVIYAGEKEGWGTCVVLRHPGNVETWYGPLTGVRVSQSDWVQARDFLGEAAGDRQGTVRFGVKRDGQFIDPVDVIGIE